MSKKNKTKSGLGRSLINDRFGKSKARRSKDPSILHSSEVPDGYDWGRLNLKSVTEESSFQEFLSTAQLAGTEFQTEKLNITFVNPFVGNGLLTTQERKKADEIQEENKQFLTIPRRPKWDKTTTPEQLETMENEEFLEWRRRLAILQDEKELVLTPYEKNLEFWRQLWRVVERSDVVVQIVDARNPLLFRCEDLENYVQEVSPHKQNLILLNKADYLTDVQRQIWADYFEKHGLRVAFYSATKALEGEECNQETNVDELPNSVDALKVDCKEEEEEDDDGGGDDDDDSKEPGNGPICEAIDASKDIDHETVISRCEEELLANQRSNNDNENLCSTTIFHGNQELKISLNDVKNESVKNSNELLNRSQLISLFRCIHTGVKVTSGVTAIGLVGYPNVGKSSTINSLLLEKKVSVSATPGKTKHFQTLFLDEDLLLCDCPGLVMPSFVYSKADMVINGILSIDQMRDHVPPISLVASLIPRHIMEDTYGIMIPPPREGENPSRSPTSEELLNAYGYNRGFMTQNGQPDNPRSARHVLKDFVNGKLLFCKAPPEYVQEDFHAFPERRRKAVTETEAAKKRTMVNSSSDLDNAFFRKSVSSVHTKGLIPGSSVVKTSGTTNPKPWKDHSVKRNKREKLRRVYVHLDQL